MNALALFNRSRFAAMLVVLLLVGGAHEALAQRVTAPVARRVRTYIPPDELVSFLPSTPTNEFITLLNPIFLRVTGKQLVDPMDRTEAIGVALNGVHFIDAFELVLDRAGLDFRETENYFVIQERATVSGPGEAVAVAADVSTNVMLGDGEAVDLPATADSREIRIDAIIFELNANRAREIGTNWASLFGQATGGSTGGGSTGGGSTGGGTDDEDGGSGSGVPPRFFLDASSFFDALDGFIESSSDRVDLAVLLRLFRYFETLGIGETVGSPYVTVQSGEQGRIQSGADIPINLQDFQGNTVTQFVSTGIIIDVTPTLITDNSGEGEGLGPVEFVHLDVKVEKSAGRPSAAGITIDKSEVNTQVLLVDGEQTVIGGLYTTEENVSRSGIPLLMDIPILKYLFSYRTRNVIQKELIIVLQARVVDPVRDRQARPRPTNVYARERQDLRERLDQFRPGQGRDFETITPDDVPDATQAPQFEQGAGAPDNTPAPGGN